MENPGQFRVEINMASSFSRFLIQAVAVGRLSKVFVS